MPGGGTFELARTLIALIGVCALAWATLTWLSRRGLGLSRLDSRLRLLGRLPLGPRRQLFLVQADTRVFLIGAGDNGPLALIAELDAPTAPPAADSGS